MQDALHFPAGASLATSFGCGPARVVLLLLLLIGYLTPSQFSIPYVLACFPRTSQSNVHPLQKGQSKCRLSLACGQRRVCDFPRPRRISEPLALLCLAGMDPEQCPEPTSSPAQRLAKGSLYPQPKPAPGSPASGSHLWARTIVWCPGSETDPFLGDRF